MTRLCIKLTALLLVYTSISGCAATYKRIERVISPNSSARVSPAIEKIEAPSPKPTYKKPYTQKTATYRPAPPAKPTPRPAAPYSKPAASYPRPASTKTATKTATERTKPVENTPAATTPSANKPQQAKVIKPQPVQSNGVPVTVAAVAKPQTTPVTPATPTYGSLSGAVRIIGKDQKVIPADGLMLRLSRTDGRAMESDGTNKTHIVDMEDKTYKPGHMTIKAGDTLSFANKDSIKHNVFSSTGNNAFDLGTYDGGLKRDVTLNEAGVVKVYCNIHRNMAMFVSVDDKGRSTLANSKGSFSFDNLAPGKYKLEIWHIRGQKTVSVTIKPGKQARISEELNTSGFNMWPTKISLAGPTEAVADATSLLTTNFSRH